MASVYTLDFEKPLQELEQQIEDLQRLGRERQIDVAGELDGLQGKLESLRAEIYRNLTPIQRVHAWPATRAARTPSTTSAASSPTSSSCTATGSTATTRPSSAAWRGSAAAR